MPKLYILGLIALAGILIGLAWAEQITLTTYYPAPDGVYRELSTTASFNVGEQGTTTNPLVSTTTLYGDVAILPQNQDAVSGLEGGNVGIGTATPQASLHLGGPQGPTNGIMFPDGSIQTTAAGGGAGLGAWETRNNNQVYQAATDGFACGYSVNPSIITGLTDGNNPPVTIRIMDTNNPGYTFTGITFPVKRYDYWKITGAAKVYWMPLGS